MLAYTDSQTLPPGMIDELRSAASEGVPLHLTHVQFHSYGTEGDRKFSSGAAEIAFWQAMLAAATQTGEWKSDLERHFWTEMYLDGAELQQYLKRERTEMRAVLRELGLLAGDG